jgi:5-methyltetrahydrofolate--homocysteine methyltransferase
MGQPFRRQHIIGEFIADFVCLPTKLIIELDGRYHSLPEQHISDEQRTQWLQHQGYRVVRFTNEQVLYDLENTIKNIKELIYETK